MANKMTAKLAGAFSNLFGKSEAPSDKELLEKSRERERLLISKMETLLTNIQYDPNIKLPKEKIKEFKIENRVARMRKALETPLITRIDTSKLDETILSFADSLKLALEQNYEHAAYWASMALLKTVETLRIDTPELYARDTEMETALYENKLNYAKSFYNIIQLAIEQDRKEQEMATLEIDFNNKATEMRNRGNAYKGLMKTEAGIKLNAAVEAKRDNPASMTPEEKQVWDNHKRIETLQGDLKAQRTVWETVDTELTDLLKQIEMARLQLLRDPEVKDPKLAAKVKESAKIFRASLNQRLDEAYIMMTAYDEGVTELEQLLQHPAIRAKYAKIAEALAQMENNWLETAQNELEAHRVATRKAQDMAILELDLKQLEQQLQEEMDKQMETIVEQEKELEAAIEQQYEQQPEQEANYEMEYDI